MKVEWIEKDVLGVCLRGEWLKFIVTVLSLIIAKVGLVDKSG